MRWLCRRAYGGCIHGFTLTLLGHAWLSDGREHGNTFRTVKTRIGAGISGGAQRTEKPELPLLKVRWEQSHHGPGLTPAVRGSVVSGIRGWKG